MEDEIWTLSFHMKDAPSGVKFLEERMDKDLICYFDIIGLIEKQGYTSMDYLYCRKSHGRCRSELVEIISDLDVSRMVCEHEVDQKISFYVTKQIDGLNTRIRRSEQVHIGAREDAERCQALSNDGVNESDYDTEASHETDREEERIEQQALLEAIKRRRADPNLNWPISTQTLRNANDEERRVNKKHKRPKNSRFRSEDQDHVEEHGGDLDDPLELQENWEEDEEIFQDSPVHSENEEQDLAELDTTVSGVSPELGSINIIWPNGAVQEYRGRFTVSNVMNIKSGGKVLVETDDNGVPNQRSSGLLGSFLRGLAKNSSHVPLHIPRWDNKLLRKPKQELIAYVQTKILYPEETKYTTEGWMLKIVNKGWRDYKSFLKNKYYKPNKWSLDRIKKQVPVGVNKHQWITLLGTWCQEQHKKTCQRNSEAGKQQRHPHTTGRKSHARLKKEMEVKNKGPVSKIDLWDEAHKKKDGKYTNENVQQLVHKARKELAIIERKKNGELSQEDYDKVFDDVIANESTIGGYYDEKYWGDARLCRGSTSVQGSSSEVRVQKELQELKADLKNVTGFMGRMCAFMARNHPDEDWMKEITTAGNEIKTCGQQDEDPAPMLRSNKVSGNILDKDGGGCEVDGVEEPMDNVETTESDPKEAQLANDCTSQDLRNGTRKACTRKESPEQLIAQQVNIPRKENVVVIQHKVNETAEPNEIVQTSKKNTKHTRDARAKEHYQNSSSTHEQGIVKASTTKELPKHNVAQKKPKTVILISLVSRTKGLVVGKGTLESRDSKYVVEGDELGDAFCAITILAVNKLGCERLPRPFGDIQTVKDAIGHCIAWPSTHVKRLKDDSN